MNERVEGLFNFVTGAIYRRWPRKAPPASRLRSCRIVSHRGEHDNHNRIENTIDAFDAAAEAGVWGLELDIRWTKDLSPVIFHDAGTRRLYGEDVRIASTTLDALKKKFPLIPTLAEVIDRYGGRKHLMIEIKAEPYAAPVTQSGRMQHLLSKLVPGEEFHLISLHPEVFSYFDFLPARAFIPIARARVDRFSRMSIKKEWGGLAGHFLMFPRHVQTRHHQSGQGIGTGFVDSKRCLFREVNRNIDWLFSNHAARMQRICNQRTPA